jgi:hypothetical protein
MKDGEGERLVVYECYEWINERKVKEIFCNISIIVLHGII